MTDKSTVNQLVEEFLNGTDYYLVDLKVVADNKISVEIDAFLGVSLDFCAELNRHIESKLDRETEDYELEVSSAGLTEPFKVQRQYEKNIGNEVEVLTVNGKKLSGILTEVNKDSFTLQIDKMERPEGAKRKIKVTQALIFTYSDIKSTKYIYRFK